MNATTPRAFRHFHTTAAVTPHQHITASADSPRTALASSSSTSRPDPPSWPNGWHLGQGIGAQVQEVTLQILVTKQALDVAAYPGWDRRAAAGWTWAFRGFLAVGAGVDPHADDGKARIVPDVLAASLVEVDGHGGAVRERGLADGLVGW